MAYCIDKKSGRILIAVLDNRDQEALNRMAAEIEAAIQNEFADTDMSSHFPDVAIVAHGSGAVFIEGQDYDGGPMEHYFPAFLSIYADGDVQGDRPHPDLIAA